MADIRSKRAELITASGSTIKPPPHESGDLLLTICGSDRALGFTDSSATWTKETEIDNTTNGAKSLTVFSYYASSSSTTGPTISMGTTRDTNVISLAIKNVPASAAIEVINTDAGSTGDETTLPGGTPSETNELILYVVLTRNQLYPAIFYAEVVEHIALSDAFSSSLGVASFTHTETGATPTHKIFTAITPIQRCVITLGIKHSGDLKGQPSPYTTHADLITPFAATVTSAVFDDITKEVDPTGLVTALGGDTSLTYQNASVNVGTGKITTVTEHNASGVPYAGSMWSTSSANAEQVFITQNGLASSWDLSSDAIVSVCFSVGNTYSFSDGNTWIGFGSGDNGSGVATAAEMFPVNGSDVPVNNQFLVQPSRTSTSSSFGSGYNAAAIEKLYFAHKMKGIETVGMGFVQKLKPLVLVSGSANTPAKFSDLIEFATNARLKTLRNHSGAGEAVFTCQSLQVGDGVRSVVYSAPYQIVEFPSAYDTATKYVMYNIASGSLSYKIKLNSGDTYAPDTHLYLMGDFHEWGVDASSSDTDIYDFTGNVVVSATPLAHQGSNIDYSGLTYVGCKEVPHNGKSLSGVTISSVASGETAALQFSASNQTELTAIGTQCGTLSVTNNTNAPAIRINYTGAAGAVTIDLSAVTFSGNTTDLHFESTNNCDLSITRNSGTLNTTNSVGSTVTVVAPTNALRIDPDITITVNGAIRYFDGTPDDQTPNDSDTGDFLDYVYSTTDPIDIEVVEQYYVPVNQQNVTPSNSTRDITMDFDEAYNASHGLTIVTHYTFDRATKTFAILADQDAFDVRSSMADTIRTNSSYYNTPLLLEAKPGGKRIDLIDGATISSMATWKGAGMERYDSLGTTYPIEKWYAIQSVDDITGASVIYRQTNSGDFTIGALTNGKFDETLQFYSDTTVPPDNNPETNNNSYLLIKALRVGYRQARNDVVAGNGGASLKADLYTIGLAPTAHDYAGNPVDDLSLTMTLVAGGTVGGKTFAYKWVDAGTNSGSDIANWINYMGATSPNGLIPGGTGLRWAEMPDMVIYVTGGVETAQGYREGATPTLVGFYMERGGADHPDMVRAQSDDGTYYEPAESATATISNFATTSRLQIYDTLNSVELYNGVPGATSYQFSETYSVDRDIRVRITNKVTTTASIMIEATVGSITASNPDVAYIANQQDDTTYNSNAVDGDTVTGITINDTTDRVEIGIAGGSVPWKDIYAYQVAWLHTAAGIRDDFAFIDAPDTANYILTGFKIKNTSSPSVPLVITSGYGRDATTGASIDLIDTTGGSLFFAPDHVIPYATGSGVTSADKTEIIAGVTSSVSDTLPDAVWQSTKAIPKLLSVE